MADYVYKAGKRDTKKKRRKALWLFVLLVVIGLAGTGYIFVRDALKPQTVLKQSKATQKKVTYETKTKHYELPDFTIDIPIAWTPVARPAGPYQSFTWQTSEHGTNGQSIEIFEDTIPPNFGFNRALIVSGQSDHLNIEGTASDNCSKYTKKQTTMVNQFSAVAKWQGVDFLCDLSNVQRDVIGTSSTDGINTVILKSPSTGAAHKFLFSYTNHGTNPDYTVFYEAIQSFRMQ
ncbi:MAG: hypothetical protein JWO35_491 [Candidatus Saccharibacteria bacterium]|nr:hypothetical protein [Candidatus Saccharibacteria bacterium]